MKSATLCIVFLLGTSFVIPAFAQFTTTTLVSPNPQDEAQFGVAVAGAGDVNNDGHDDVIVGTGRENGVATEDGSAHIFSGADGSLLRSLFSPNPESNGNFGEAVAGAGDLNGDGHAEVLVGAWSEDGGATSSGRAYVFNGADGSVLFSLVSPNPESGGRFGETVSSVPDANGDGIPDLLIAANNEDAAASGDGRAYLFSGADGSLLLTLESPSPVNNGWFGRSVSGVEDVNGDGRGDLIVSATGEGGGFPYRVGRVYVLSGADGTVLHTLDAPTGVAQFGLSVAGLGDTNGDGVGDILVGAFDDASRDGRAFILSGADGTVLHALESPDVDDSWTFGSVVANAGDVNNDGWDDAIVGADSEDGGASSAGRAYVFSGSDGSLLHTLESPEFEDGGEFGISVAGAGDVNNDGQADLIVGAEDEDGGGIDGAGKAHLFVSIPPPPTDSPAALVEDAIAGIEEILDAGGLSKKARKNLNKALTKLESALDRLENAGAARIAAALAKPDANIAKVFDELKSAVKALLRAEKAGVDVADIIESVAEAARILAQEAVDEAQEFAGDPAVDKLIARALERMDKAEDHRDADRPDKAIKEYKKAWKFAQKAIEKGQASKSTPDLAAADEGVRPTEFTLHPNYPNPFNPSTTITFDLPRAADITLSIYNLRGQLVRTLHAGPLTAGTHRVVWDGTDSRGAKVASGLYVYRLHTGEQVLSRKLMLMK